MILTSESSRKRYKDESRTEEISVWQLQTEEEIFPDRRFEHSVRIISQEGQKGATSALRTGSPEETPLPP